MSRVTSHKSWEPPSQLPPTAAHSLAFFNHRGPTSIVWPSLQAQCSVCCSKDLSTRQVLNVPVSQDAGHVVMLARVEGSSSQPPILDRRTMAQRGKGTGGHPVGPDEGWGGTHARLSPALCPPAPTTARHVPKLPVQLPGDRIVNKLLICVTNKKTDTSASQTPIEPPAAGGGVKDQGEKKCTVFPLLPSLIPN